MFTHTKQVQKNLRQSACEWKCKQDSFSNSGIILSASEIKQKVLTGLSQGWVRLLGPKCTWHLLSAGGAEGTWCRCLVPTPSLHCAPRSRCDDLVWEQDEGKRVVGWREADFFPLLLFLWFGFFPEFGIGAESAEALKFGGLRTLVFKALGPSYLSHGQALGAWLADPHSKAIPALFLTSIEVPQHSCGYLLPLLPTRRVSISPWFHRQETKPKGRYVLLLPKQPTERCSDLLCLTFGRVRTSAASVSPTLSPRQGLLTCFPGRLCSELPLRAERALPCARGLNGCPGKAVCAPVRWGSNWAGAGSQQNFVFPSGKDKASHFNSNSPWHFPNT